MIKSRNILVFIIIVSMVSLIGCSSKSSAEKKPSTAVGQKPEAPAELKSMAGELDMLIAALDKKFKIQKMPTMQQNIQLNPQGKSQGGQLQNGQSQGTQAQSGQSQSAQSQGTQAQSGQSQSGQSQGTQTQGGQSQGAQSQGTQTQGGQSQGAQSQGTQTQGGQSQNGQSQGTQTQGGQSQGAQSQGTQTQGGQSQIGQSQNQSTDWQKEFSSLKTLHTSWNNLMPEAVAAGMSIDSRNQFSKSLDQLTQDISKQKLEDSLASTLMLYKNYADLTQLFTSSVPAEFYQLKYEIMAAIFEASRKNWTAAEEHAPKIKERWVYLSAQAKESDPKILNRTEFAVLDLQQAITSKQMELVMIKGEIAMTNLKSLEEKLSSKPSGQGQQSSSQ
ncbi:MAG: hypothetical protein CVU90_02775 [Firmicutes bacterium HGW-Firmicutes-15]|nr:MAG: hypothetical protein CVU90_02775 [Firmicutes bacterium HGW-Firmicutes-15]